MWKDVQAVDTPELKLQKYDTDMFWLMADEQFATEDKGLPAVAWLEHGHSAAILLANPYYFGLPHLHAPPTMAQPVPQTGGAPPTNQTTSSVESFANKISNSVETTSAGHHRRRRIVPGRQECG